MLHSKDRSIVVGEEGSDLMMKDRKVGDATVAQ